MSRVANNPVQIPSGVTVTIDNSNVAIKGSKGQLELTLHHIVDVKHEGDQLIFASANSAKQSRALAGTMRSLVNNMVTGVSQGFERKLELVGVGYKAQAKGNVLGLSLGYSHPIDYQLPDGISAETPTQTEILLKGIDKQKIGQVAAEIRALRAPEPYKGKGVRYAGERVAIKEAKKK
ncbi:50S ribosomal protein L6 [Allohahella sp. A8]|uniref:50S ribosomal protein L6 n=1 Tax=Allohahella sp. A8 TaxID=3141461 RepID=UPI000C0AE5EE|nr:50S ribosomal protein L6 [Hahellaceae bacterium]|tara:strand:- start:22648 stop:23181 length:534 start_codon:yes stop_codon:yes gene_type:complete